MPLAASKDASTTLMRERADRRAAAALNPRLGNAFRGWPASSCTAGPPIRSGWRPADRHAASGVTLAACPDGWYGVLRHHDHHRLRGDPTCVSSF